MHLLEEVLVVIVMGIKAHKALIHGRVKIKPLFSHSDGVSFEKKKVCFKDQQTEY